MRKKFKNEHVFYKLFADDNKYLRRISSKKTNKKAEVMKISNF